MTEYGGGTFDNQSRYEPRGYSPAKKSTETGSTYMRDFKELKERKESLLRSKALIPTIGSEIGQESLDNRQ